MGQTAFKFNLAYTFRLALVSSLGGLLFGYDWVVIGGAKPFYEVYFEISKSSFLQGWAMSSALLGCILGTVVSGFLSEKYGRKNPLCLAAILFVISAFGTGYIDSFNAFVFFRVVGGLAIGLASTLSPIYIAEIAPTPYRGRFVALNQLAIVIGILLAQLVNWTIAKPVPEGISAFADNMLWNVETGWRWMFWAELAPAVLFFLLVLTIPKSPRYLLKTKNRLKAFQLLERIGGENYAKYTVESITSTLNMKSVKIGASPLFSRYTFPIVLLGIVLAVFQQWCGINIIFNYAQEIFAAAGYGVNEMFVNIVVTGSINLLFTLVAFKTVDSWGRRNLMLFGALGLSLVYTVLGLAYYLDFDGQLILLLVLMAIAIYAMSVAPVVWIVLSEIFPNRVRGKAMAIATSSLWISSFMVTISFPMINELLNSSGAFWLYSLICALGFVYIFLKLPETKGKSLEEIEMEFLKKH